MRFVVAIVLTVFAATAGVRAQNSVASNYGRGGAAGWRRRRRAGPCARGARVELALGRKVVVEETPGGAGGTLWIS